MEFVKFWMNKSKVGGYTYIKLRYGLMSVNIKLQEDKLNMNLACSACLWRKPANIFTTHPEARVTLAVFFPASAILLYDDMNT